MKSDALRQVEKSFSRWYSWNLRNSYPGVGYPGIYIIAISNSDISGRAFNFRSEIVYIGMTNSVSGLRGRLSQFDNTIARKRFQHGGAERFLYKHQVYSELVTKLFVALNHIECVPKEATAATLRAMGEVARAEYECMAHCVEQFGHLPEFNCKELSRKYSLTYGRNLQPYGPPS